MSRSTVNGPSSSTTVAPASAAAARCASRLDGPNANPMTSGGRSPRAFVPRAVAVGDEDDDAVGGRSSGVDDGLDRLGRHEREVDRQDEDGRGAAGDDVVAGLGQPAVEAAGPLAEGPRAELGGTGQDVAVGLITRTSASRSTASAAATVRAEEPLDEVVALLGVERFAEPRLGARRGFRPG